MDNTIVIGPVENHRSREGGAMVYPVYSRRSKGLSVGINLFPDRKVCSFDCPYCEVFPFKTDIRFSLETMKGALRSAIIQAKDQGIAVRDICFSGNGEPTMSPFFPEALEAVSAIRDELAREADLVLITNGTFLLDEALFEFLRRAAGTCPGPGLHIWLKLDAGTEAWYQEIDRSGVPFDRLMGRMRDFAALAPFTIQTMLCKVRGETPSPEEGRAWVRFVAELAALEGPGLRGVQLYGKARPAPEDPLAQDLGEAFLEERAASLRAALDSRGKPLLIETFP
jgi:histidinol dehydrogenase